MADRRVKVTFSAEIQNYKQAMADAAAATEKLKKSSEDAGKASEGSGKKSTNASKEAAAAAKAAAKATAEAAKAEAEASKKRADALQGVGQAAAIGGAAILAGVGLAVKSYADFDKQMSAVDAATHETAGNMQLLRDAAVKAGADTAFSAGEAAQGIEELAKAGVSTKDILAGGLNGSLALAAAGSLDVGKAAEIAASALTQFKLSGDKVPHVADLLAAGAGKAQGSVEDLGAALNQSGLIASSTGLTIEETTGALAAFASAGLTGSDAGTSFKTMLMSLNPSSKEAAALMEKLGINAYDAQGKFVGMSEYAGILQNALKGMSDEQRNATLKTIFGSDAVRAANVLYDQGAEGINKWEAAVNDAGYAADTAARMQNNLAGDLEKLGGSFDTVLIQSGSGANDVLRGLVQTTEGLVDAVGKVPAPVLAVGVGLATVVGGAALVGGALITVIPKIAATREAFNLLAPAGSKAGAALSRTGRLAAGAASGITAVAVASAAAAPLLDKILAPTGETGDALEAFAGQAAQGAVGADTLSKSFQDLVQHKDGVNDFQTAIEGIADPGVWGNIDNVLVGGIKILSLGMADVTSTSDKARERMKALGEQLSSLDPEKAAESFQSMAKATDGSNETLTQLLDLMPDYRKQLEEQAKASGQATDDQTLLDIALGKIPTSAAAAGEAITGAGTAAAGAKEPTAEVAKALDEMGISADGTITSLEKFTQALFDAGLSQLSARDAARNWSQALLDMGLQADGTGGKVGALGTEFDNTTAKGIKNQAMFDGVAQAGIRNAQSMAAAGASNQELQGALNNTYNGLIAAAGQFGITGTKADALARSVLGVPDGVSIQSWMSSEAKRMADLTTGALNGIPRQVTISVDTYKTTFEKLVGLPASSAPPSSIARPKATGGRVPGYADGGQLPTSGPGTDVTDGFLGISSAGVPMARVDAGEWIINRGSSGRYNRELAAINAGTFPKLPGYANGGLYAAQSFGAASSPNVNVAAPAVAVYIGNEQLDARTYRVATSAIQSADSNSQYIRTGSR